jgi:hypothetical protein
MSEAEVLKRQVASKKKDVEKLRGEVIRSKRNDKSNIKPDLNKFQ